VPGAALGKAPPQARTAPAALDRRDGSEIRARGCRLNALRSAQGAATQRWRNRKNTDSENQIGAGNCRLIDSEIGKSGDPEYKMKGSS